MGQVGVPKAYQDLIRKADFLSGLIAVDKLDLNNYVTDKALGGVYYMVGEEERKIRRRARPSYYNACSVIEPIPAGYRAKQLSRDVVGHVGMGCQPASAHKWPLTAEFRIRE